jgi:hypothetical protein
VNIFSKLPDNKPLPLPLRTILSSCGRGSSGGGVGIWFAQNFNLKLNVADNFESTYPIDTILGVYHLHEQSMNLHFSWVTITGLTTWLTKILLFSVFKLVFSKKDM